MKTDIMTHIPILLRPDPSRVVIKPFVPAEDPPGYVTKDRPRAQRIADRFGVALYASTTTRLLVDLTARSVIGSCFPR